MKKSFFRSLLPSLYLMLLCGLLCAGCSVGKQRRELARIQSSLDESDLLIEARDFDHAKEKSMQAIQELAPLVQNNPHDIDCLLLRARACLTAFIAKNSGIIEATPPRPRSLVPLPERGAYIDYDPDIVLAEADIRSIINHNPTLTKEQEAAIYATLATIYRLDAATLGDADLYYERAIAANNSLIDEVRQQKPNIFTNRMHTASVHAIGKQQKQLQMAQIEVNLAAEKWDKALTLLMQLAGGEDVQFFATQFQILENNLSDIQNKLRDEFYANAARQDNKSREIAQAQEQRQVNDPSVLRAIGSYTPYEAALMQTELELVALKNNLIYRLICYYNLGQDAELTRTRQILARFYPEKEKQVMKALGSKNLR